MKSLFLIIFLLIPSISIARPLLSYDDDKSFLHTIMIIEAIKESKQPPSSYEQSKPTTRTNKELTDQQIKELSERLNNQLWENNNDD